MPVTVLIFEVLPSLIIVHFKTKHPHLATNTLSRLKDTLRDTQTDKHTGRHTGVLYSCDGDRIYRRNQIMEFKVE